MTFDLGKATKGDSMKKVASMAIIALLLIGGAINADEVYTLEEAKSVSAQTGKLILIKFFKEG